MAFLKFIIIIGAFFRWLFSDKRKSYWQMLKGTDETDDFYIDLDNTNIIIGFIVFVFIVVIINYIFY